MLLDTPQGRLLGHRADAVARFLGIPYAAAPLGALRLRSPRPAPRWAGTRDATRPGPASLQGAPGHHAWLNGTIDERAEDCLTLNVWSADTTGRAPVLLWVHGGQTRFGHGAAPAIDGAALARQGVVVVTINYRLGALGGLAHPALADAETGLCANWGLQDKLAALAWVRDHIAAFGGDPARVTLAGQSSGAANVVMLAQHGLGIGTYARIAVHSPPLFRPPMFVDLPAAAEYTEAFAASLGVAVTALRDIDGLALQRAEQAFATSPELTARMGRPRTAPVRDGVLIRDWPLEAPAAGVPVLAGWTRSESDFWFHLRDAQGLGLAPQKAPQTEADLDRRVAALIGLHYAFADAPSAEAVIERYRPGVADVPALWRRLYTDLAFRAPILQFLGRQAQAGQPAWGWEFAHPIASADGGTPHAADVPFVFGTTGLPHFTGAAGLIGDAARAARSSAAMQAAWLAFIREGDPAAAGMAWPRFDASQPQVLRFSDDGQVDAGPPERAPALACWPAYAA